MRAVLTDTNVSSQFNPISQKPIMAELPKSLEEAIAQAKEATQAALNDGNTRLQVELVFPEITLQALSIAQAFIPLFENYGSGLKVFFSDTGTAALARRDWGTVPFKIDDLGTSRSPVERKIEPEDEAFLLVAPSAIEVAQVEKLCNLAGERPCILLIPQLEDLYVVGIGFTARQLRDRFLKTLETCYYIRSVENAAVFRYYPSLWQVWLEVDENYQLIAEETQKPAGETLDLILSSATGTDGTQQTPVPKKPGFLTNLQRLINSLTR